MRALLSFLLCFVTPALAREPLTAEAYEDLVEGRTLTFGESGAEPYGLEHYFPNRRVVWGWIGGDECIEGRWYAEGDPASPAICFVYEDDPEAQCWRFFLDEGDRLVAEFLNEPGSQTLYEIQDAPGGLVCGGVGV